MDRTREADAARGARPAHPAPGTSSAVQLVCSQPVRPMPQLRNVLDCLVSTQLKFQGELLTEHGPTEQHERPQKSPRLGLGRLRRLRPSAASGPSARSPRAAGARGLCRRPDGASPQTPVPIAPPRLQLPSDSALFYIEGGFYTSGPVGLLRVRVRARVR